MRSKEGAGAFAVVVAEGPVENDREGEGAGPKMKTRVSTSTKRRLEMQGWMACWDWRRRLAASPMAMPMTRVTKDKNDMVNDV